ncbi:MAG: CoA transferase [Chloroflexi bacterium]|nr:CoA transferase [Chloroflexota bacterium]
MEKKEALAGLKVLEFTRVIVGPHAGRMLAEHGAEVVIVETIHHPDLLRLASPHKDGITGINRSGYSSKYALNKYGISLNLELPEARDVFKRLVLWADVVIESQGPGVAARLGLTYEDLRKLKPDLIMASTSQMGKTGPWAAFKGYGYQSAAMAGFTALTGYPDRDPPGPYGAYTDVVSPQFLACAILAALDYRRRTGEGQYIEQSQLEAGVHFLATTVMDYALHGRVARCQGNRDPQAAPHGCYPCRGDDRWCVIAVFTDEEWRSFCRATDHSEWEQDPRFATFQARKANEDELDRLVSEWTSRYTPHEVMELLQGVGVAAGVVATGRDLHEDAQLKHRKHWRVLDHPEMGPTAYNSPPFRLSRTPWQPRLPAPLLWQHTVYVLQEILGLSDEEIASLVESGALE